MLVCWVVTLTPELREFPGTAKVEQVPLELRNSGAVGKVGGRAF